MTVLCASIPCDDNWPSEEDMRNRNAVIKQLTERGVGECVESGGGCGKMEFCFEVADVADASAAFQALLEAHFPGRTFSFYVDGDEADD